MANWRSYIDPSVGAGQTTLDGIINDGPTYGIQISDDLNVTGLSTFSDTARFSGTVRLDGQLRDGDNAFGTSGQVLSSDGTDTRWVNAGTLSAGAASQIAINSDTNNAERFITFVNSSSGNNNLNTDTQLKYNPSTNQLNFTSSASGIKFGPGTATNDDAHIEWLGGNNAGYLRISTSDDGGSEYIQFGDYDNQDKGGTFTQWLRISRDTGTFTGTFSATTFSGSGASLTTLNASNLSSGTVNTARLPNTYTKAGQVMVQSTGAGNDVRLDAADHIILESGEEEDGAIYFRGNSGSDSYRFAKSGQTAIEGFLSFEGIDADRTYTFPNESGTVAITSSDITGNSATATTLATSRNFSISGEITANAVSFNGGGNVTLNATVDNNVIDEANLKISNSPTNGRFLQCNTGVSGGLTWAEVSLPTAATLDGTTLASGITASSITSLGTLSSLHVSGTTNLDSGADIDGGQVNIRYDHNTTPSLYVRNNAGVANTPIIAQFQGDSDSLIIKNISGGDYEISNPQQTNGIRFYDGGGGVTLVYNNVVSLEFDSGNNFGDFKGIPSVNGVNLARVSDNITGSSGGFTAGDAGNLNAGTIPAARLPNHSASLLTSGTIPAARVPTLNQNTTGSAAKLTTARTIAGTSFNGTANININYNNLTNKPTIPTNNNQLTNGRGFITSTDVRSMNEASSTGQSSTSSTSFQNKVTLSINTVSNSRVLVAYNFEIKHSNTNNHKCTAQVNGSNVNFVGGSLEESENDTAFQRFNGTILDIGSHSGTRTYRIQYKATSNTAQIQNASLVAIEMSV